MEQDNPTLRYFDAEMRYLREAGQEFAKAFPDRAAQLGMDRPGTGDPFVERLFEGFAFLMGRLREKLDDDLPELTEGVVSLLWPHYLRTVPSLAIVELTPDLSRLKIPHTLERGLEVISRPVGPARTCCRYTTTEPLVLRPLAVERLGLAFEPDGRSVLRLRLACGEHTDWNLVDLARLPLYLNADAPLAYALHRALTVKMQALYVRLPGQAQRRRLAGCFKAKGFADEERLWPKGDSAFSGYQLLLEYFSFPEKFLFVTLHGLEHLQMLPGTAWLELDIVLSEAWPHQFALRGEHLRLHSVPVINLFSLRGDPINLDPLQSEHLLRPQRLQDGHTEIYSVDSVTALGTPQPGHYVPFTSFRHRGGMLRDDAPERYFHTRVRQGPNGLHDTWLILGGEAFEDERLLAGQRVSLSLTATNGQLPRKALTRTLLDRMAVDLPGVSVRNLSAPTLPCYPPSRDRFHWRVLSHLGSQFLPMLDNAEVLRGTLALYDWASSELNRRRLEAIVEVKHRLLQRIDQGFVARGVAIEVTIDSGGFCGAGDINLFGEMLNRFFALYADVHLFNQLTLLMHPEGKRLQWNENHNLHIPG